MDLVPRWTNLASMVRLALPIVGVQVGIMLTGVVDTIMVGRISATDLAAVAIGNAYFFTIAVFGIGMLMALDPIVAQAVGADDSESVARGIQRGFVLTVLLALVASLLFLPSRTVFVWLRQPEDVVPVAAGYIFGSIPGMLPYYTFAVLRQSLQAMGRLSAVVWTIVAANLLNVFLNWVLIFGNLGFPRMGAVGSAWGSSVARWFMAALLLALAWPTLRPYLARLRRKAFDVLALARMIRLGTPLGFQHQLEFGAFSLIGMMMGWLGTVSMAGHQVALNLAALAFQVPMGIAGASAVLVGRAVGGADMVEARRNAGAGILLGGSFMLVTACAFLAAPGPLARVYTADAGVLAIAVALLPIAGIFQVADGLQAVAAGVLRGAGDTRSPFVFNALGFWVFGIPVSAALAFWADMGAQGLWWGLAAGLGVVAILLFVRVRRLLERDVKRVMIDGPEVATPSRRRVP